MYFCQVDNKVWQGNCICIIKPKLIFMKTKIIVCTLLAAVFAIGKSNVVMAHPHGHHNCYRSHEIVRDYAPRGYYEGPVVEHIHNRRYHPTPWCNKPVVFARECHTSPWYYVDDVHEARLHPRRVYHEVCHERGCGHHEGNRR